MQGKRTRGIARVGRAVSFGLMSFGLAAGVLSLGGCAGYTSYPPLDGSLTQEIDSPGANEVMIEAVRWMSKYYPPTAMNEDGVAPETEFAVGLPRGVKPHEYEWIVSKVSPLARPLTPETEHLPTYFITRVWLRGGKAEVDVLRPAAELGSGTDGRPVYQSVQVSVRGGLTPWRVDRHRVRQFSVLTAPEPYYFTPKGSRPAPTVGGEASAAGPRESEATASAPENAGE